MLEYIGQHEIHIIGQLWLMLGIGNASDILILIRAQVYVLICLWVWLILTLYY